MWIVFDFIKTNYITLLILITILVMMATNRSNQIPGTGMILAMCCIIFLITLAEYAEVVIDNQNLDYRLLYVKAALVYWLYPLLILLFLFITDHVKYRVLMTIPWLIHAVVVAIDLTGTGLMYHYGPNHGFHGGVLTGLPFFVEAFYVVLLVIYSIRNLKEKNKIKGGIIFFMALGVILTQILTFLDFPNSYMPAVAGLETLTYYFYLSAIQSTKTREELINKELALEKNRSNLLLAQIRPHFINSNLAVIRSLCYEDTEKAVEMIDHFSAYLRDNIKQIDDSRLVSFETEMESVDNYLYLEQQRFQDRIRVERDLQVTDFYVPPLSVQTIVENAIRHGISMTGKKGTVWIATKREEGRVQITIRDDGCGFDPDKVSFDGVTHVGVKNVKDRISRILGGRVQVESIPGEGTCVTFWIPEKETKKGSQPI